MRAPLPTSLPLLQSTELAGSSSSQCLHSNCNLEIPNLSDPNDYSSHDSYNSPPVDYNSTLLNLCCYNARGLSSSTHYIQDILKRLNIDFIAISEHWLHNYNLKLIHQLSDKYKFVAVPSTQDEDSVHCVPRLIKGHGGVALGWRSTLDDYVSLIPFVSSCRMVGVKCDLSQRPLFIISTYLPSRSGCTDIFKETLDQLEAAILLLPPGAEIIIMGDLNADLGHLGGPMACTHINEQGKILYRYLTKWNFISTHLHLQPTTSSYTYESDAHSTQSTLDHILCPKYMLPKFILSYTIIEEPLNTSDHNPVFATLRKEHYSSHPPQGLNASSFSPPNWSASSKEDIHRLYTTPLQHSLKPLLHNMPLPSSLAHNPTLIDHFLQSFTSALLSASTHIPSKSFYPHRSPGWNSSLKQASRVCKRHYHCWVAAGRPRDPSNPVRMAYKEAKKHFRSCLRLHRRLSAENFFASLDIQTTDPQRFFRAIRKHTSPSISHTQRLIYNNKVYDNDNIMEGWASYFESLGTPADVPLTKEQLLVLESYHTTQSMPADEPDLVSEEEVRSIIHSLPLKKAAGPDHVTNEHLKFGGSILPPILSSLFNAILISGHIPTPFKLGLIIPIPKGHDKDLSIPTNYRGITLLSVIGKVFEKVLLHRVSDQQAHLNPLQGGFRPGFSCLHSAFILQEAISSVRERKKKVFVAFLDVKKAFDTVWHEGLLLKLALHKFPMYIWHILNNWYSSSTSAVLWNSCISRSFRIRQGVRQGAILSPLLYSSFVDGLLDQLSTSGHGVYIDDVFCGAPMYADDLALISDSAEDLQSMLDITSNYALLWRYQFNASKSAILVFGESPISRKRNRPSRKWLLGGDEIPECDTHSHLGILRTVLPSSVHRTIARCSSARSAFFALNAVGSRFGCLHPCTSFKLYSSLCIPILLYGCELWSLTKSEVTMLERVHCKILRTIQGLPLRCPSIALRHLMGVPSVLSMIHQRQLNFMYSLSTLPLDSLPHVVFEKRLASSPPLGIIPSLHQLVQLYDLPAIPTILSGDWSKLSWKRWLKKMFQSLDYSTFIDTCSNLPLSDCDFRLGKPISHWMVCQGLPSLTKENNFRIRLLVNCHGLEEDACRFRHRRFTNCHRHDPTCRLCGQEPEDPSHFIIRCPALSSVRASLLHSASSELDLNSLSRSDPSRFVNLVLGMEWADDSPLQHFFIRFLHTLRERRNSVLVSAH